MSDILNIDTGTLSDGFYENADALAAMEAAANGDADAIDTLRDLATQDIIQHMEIQAVDGANIEQVRNELLVAQQELQSMIDANQITMTTDLDTTQYVQKLNEMIQMGQITAEQASQALSSMGVSGTIETRHGMARIPVQHMRMTNVVMNED